MTSLIGRSWSGLVKAARDRHTVLPEPLADSLRLHLERVKALHVRDLKAGFGCVELPYALPRKYPRACRERCWQYAFPAAKFSRDPRTGAVRRHHLDETSLQKAVRAALREAGVTRQGAATRSGTVLRRTCRRTAMT